MRCVELNDLEEGGKGADESWRDVNPGYRHPPSTPTAGTRLLIQPAKQSRDAGEWTGQGD